MKQKRQLRIFSRAKREQNSRRVGGTSREAVALTHREETLRRLRGFDKRQVRRCNRNLTIRAVLVLLVGCVALLPATSLAQFLPTPIMPSVTVSQESVAAGSTFDVLVTFQLDPGVHLYRDKISLAWETLQNAEHIENVFPPGRKAPDKFGPDPTAMIEVYEGSARIVAKMRSTGKKGDSITISGKLRYQGCTDEICYAPGSYPFKFELTTGAAGPAKPDEKGVAGETTQKPSSAAAAEKVEAPPEKKSRGVVWLILMSFAAGVLISLTPCVYPMIPVTAAIIGGTKQKGTLGALFSSLVYVLGLSIVYALLGLLVASGGAKVRAWLTSPWVLVPIAGIFVLLALSMFEVITIQIQPKSLTRLQTKSSQKRRLLAIFSLGMASGLVAGPCITAPLAWILVLVAQQANKLVGFFMLFSLAWGMGIILIVAGTVTSALPQAGEWTLWVKKLFGFVMLWAAAYFLSSVIGERAYHVATAVILIAAAVFLGGFDALTKESGIAERAKRLIGLLAIFGAAYLLMGDFMPGQRVASVSPFREATYEDVQEAITSGQPTVLDFYAEWCEICKALDRKTFSEPRVVDALSRFHALKIDVERELEVVKEYRILGPPTIVFISSDGKDVESLRFSGFKDADEFLSILRRVK